MAAYNPPYSVSNEMINYISKIMEIIGKVDYYQDLNRLPRLRKQNRIRSIYSSCAIEANSLSLNQVSDIIEGKQVIGPEKEIKEVKNAILAYKNIESINPFDIKDLLKTHKILTTELIDYPGTFRNNQEGVFDGERCIFIAPPHNLVPGLMDDLFKWINENKKKVHPLILSSVFHYEFVFIHPFKDGNGRMARLWQSAILGTYNPIYYWIPLENFIKDHQEEYYNAISESNSTGNSSSFITFMLKMIYETLSKIQEDITVHTTNISLYIKKLLNVMDIGLPMTSIEIMDKLNIKSKETFRKNYLNPAIENGLIEFELPERKTSRNQRYIRIK